MATAVQGSPPQKSHLLCVNSSLLRSYKLDAELIFYTVSDTVPTVAAYKERHATLRPPHRSNTFMACDTVNHETTVARILWAPPPPPWLHPDSLRDIVHHETMVDPNVGWAPPPPPSGASDAPRKCRLDPFVDNDVVLLAAVSHPVDAPSGARAISLVLQEVRAEMLLAHASPLQGPFATVGILQEVRASKDASSTAQLEGGVDGVMSLRGVGDGTCREQEEQGRRDA
ncbi:hypothetical protein CEK25_004145 [Fusarium fujikuroi]|nr:hypothetical protein CEK25_004145 [Fusarium fujikuroi]